MFRPIAVFIIVAGISPNLWADMPTWAKKNSTRKVGNNLTSACEGTGPSVSLARKEAINNCQVVARQFLNSEIKIKSLSVETESSVGFHQEIEESGVVKNLVCDPQKEETFEKDDQFQIWIQCRFDLAKVTLATDADKVAAQKVEGTSITGLASSKPSAFEQADKDYQLIFIEVVPQCESVIIRGKKPRTISCDTNPLRISLDASDEELLVRAKGYQPKTVSIQKGGIRETLRIFLDRN
jgi:hypothetical protein